MDIFGEINKSGLGYQGFIADRRFDSEIQLVPYPLPDNPDADKKYPSWTVQVPSKRGRWLDSGAAWEKISKAGKPYMDLNVKIGGETQYFRAVQFANKACDFVIVKS